MYVHTAKPVTNTNCNSHIYNVTQTNFQKYFSYIVSISFLCEGNQNRENHRPVARHYQILSHNVASSTPRHEQGLNSQL